MPRLELFEYQIVSMLHLVYWRHHVLAPICLMEHTKSRRIHSHILIQIDRIALIASILRFQRLLRWLSSRLRFTGLYLKLWQLLLRHI